MIGQIDAEYIKANPLRILPRFLSYLFFEGRPLTTRGRWVNPLIFSHFALEKHLPPLKKVGKPIFIIGTGRSGTTILGIVLSMHRKVGFLNEPKALWASVFPKDDLVGSYQTEPGYYRLDEAHATPEVVMAAHKLYGAYLRTTFSERIIDKYPEMVFRVPFLRKIFPDARFLFLVRNGWDTCQSIDLWSKRLGMKNGENTYDWWGVNNRKWHLLVDQVVAHNSQLSAHIEEIRAFSDHRQMAAVEWAVTMAEGIKLAEQYPQAVHTVKYEALTDATDVALNEILEFCDLCNDKRFLKYGMKVLSPTSSKKPFELLPAIKAVFLDTMARLGY